MENISVYTSEIIDTEKKKVHEHLARLSRLQNKPISEKVLTTIVTDLIKRGYHSAQVSDAVDKLADQDLPKISLHVILQQLQQDIPSSQGFDDLCLLCGDKDYNGDFIASGFLPALETSDDGLCHEVRVACNCNKGKRLAHKFALTLWNGKDQMFSKKKKSTLTVYNKNSDEFPMNMMDLKAKMQQKRKSIELQNLPISQM
jgi:hypothetical protein